MALANQHPNGIMVLVHCSEIEDTSQSSQEIYLTPIAGIQFKTYGEVFQITRSGARQHSFKFGLCCFLAT